MDNYHHMVDFFTPHLIKYWTQILPQRANMLTLIGCATQCITAPIIKKSGLDNPTVLDLLLSTSSVANQADKEKVRKMFQTLIDLKNPLINRMLEIAAYFASCNNVYFYFTNTDEISRLVDSDCAGAYVASHKLILVPVALPGQTDKPESVLVHELAHFIAIKVGAHPHRSSNRFFTDTFKREGLEGPGTSLRGHAPYELQRLEMFHAITSGYEESIQEGEYVPFFLGKVVSAALSTPDPFLAISPEDFPEINAYRAAYVFSILFRQMPTLNSQILHQQFKKQVDRFYVQAEICRKLIEFKVPSLDYYDGYAGEFPETAKIVY